MNIEKFFSILEELGGDFYTGVPDSLLGPFIDGIVDRHGVSGRHIVAANEGAAVGLAAGHYLATARPAVVYMQNSGLGNAINPICSLLHKKVSSIPAIFVIGWRGEPGVKDEPQHVFQGEITLSLLDCLQIPYVVVSKDTQDLEGVAKEFKQHLDGGQSVAFVIRKDVLSSSGKVSYTNSHGSLLSREDALKAILAASGDDSIYVCSTGKLSREVFEIRQQTGGGGHHRDFLTVGAMGHSLMIACGIALEKPGKQVFCLDGDGAVIMHMGSLAVAAAHGAKNLVHIVINNSAHETVGGLPTVSGSFEMHKAAQALGYSQTFRAKSESELLEVLKAIQGLGGPIFIEVLCNLASRADLGRPSISPIENKNNIMTYLAGDDK